MLATLTWGVAGRPSHWTVERGQEGKDAIQVRGFPE